MCGRFCQKLPPKKVMEIFNLEEEPNLEERYNVAPGQRVAAVRRDNISDNINLDFLKWGLVPSWSKDPKIGNKMINARAETISEKPSYREAFKKRRCIIPTNGYYEWKKSSSGNQPYFIKRKDDEIFAMAGLWEVWKNPNGEILETCTIITTEANEKLSEIHHRMPVIVSVDNYKLWLEDKVLNEDWLNQFDFNLLTLYKIGPYVNSPTNEGPECIRPAS